MRNPTGLVRVGLVVLVTAMVTLAMAVPAGATQAFPTTNDQATTIQTGWWAYYNVTASEVASFLTTNSARLTEIRVDDSSTPTFDVTMVANAGDYASTWWWWFGVTSATLSSDLTTDNARLISLEPYVVSGTLYFAAVAVANTGSQDRSWWWYYGATPSSIASSLSTNQARLVSLRPYTSSGSTVYAVIEIANSGVDFASDGWSYDFNQTPTDIANQTNADGVRLISLAADPGGGFDTIYIGSEGEGWSWYYGQSGSQLITDMNNNGDRLIDITSYVSSGTTVYAGVGLDDTNASQDPINTASANVLDYANANGWDGGFVGAYIAPASSPGSAIVADNSGFRFEPASTIKALYLLYALQQVEAGHDKLSAPITYYVDPADPTNPGVCPDPAWDVAANAVTTTVGNALTLMMHNSDNRVTRAFEVRYGIANVQAMATGLGMSETYLRQAFIGCGFRGAVRNELTLTDAATLYAAVVNKTALDAKYSKKFFSIELGGAPAPTDYLTTVVDQEAASLGKTTVAASFLAHIDDRWKAGSYSFCMASACSAYKADFTIAGTLYLPFKEKGKIKQIAYVYGDFVNDLYVPCTPGSGCSAENAAYAMINQVADEAARGPIDSALSTWK